MFLQKIDNWCILIAQKDSILEVLAYSQSNLGPGYK